jgi:tRNA pseudouridine38/39 synthase
MNVAKGRLLDALERTCLIESRSSCNYSRCGRTDSGVSSVGQVVGVTVRSVCTEGVGTLPNAAGKPGAVTEIDYCLMLNR